MCMVLFGMTIREYQPSDKSSVESCFIELQSYECNISADRKPGTEISDKYVKYLLEECAKNQGKLFVADVDGEVIGFICGWVEDAGQEIIRQPERQLYVSDFVVTNQHQHQGIGKQLLEKMEEYGKEIGVTSIILEVLEKNEVARQAYEKYGFDGYQRILVKKL